MNYSIGMLKTLCTLVCMIASSNLVAQVTEVDAYVQDARVGLVDEFFKRFNGTVSHPDVVQTPKGEARKKNLLLLLDLSQYNSEKDSIFKEAELMMEQVIKDSIKINYSDSTWAALAHCRGTIDKKPVSFDLYLTVKHRGNDMYKWVIAKAKGECFDITSRNAGGRIMLYPDDHETKFISLMRMTKEQPFNVKQFIAEGFEYDATSVFSYLVHSQRLKIDYVEELEFIFTQIPGYIFTLKNFERESGNSGWLISQFTRCNENEKNNFLESLHVNVHSGTIEPMTENETCTSNEEVVYMPSHILEDFERRKQELVVSIKEYINILHKKKTAETQAFYRKKLCDMFAPDAKVFVTKSSSMTVMDMDDFCKLLFTYKKKASITVSSICVPIWNDDVVPTIINKEKCMLPSSLLDMVQDDGITLPSYHQMLPVCKEQTEDGIEWIPVFGDLYITIK